MTSCADPAAWLSLIQQLCAGKSASLIMRKIQPGALAAAKAHHMEETVGWLRSLSLQDAAEPGPGGAMQPIAAPSETL